jgi:hypothetical protein
LTLLTCTFQTEKRGFNLLDSDHVIEQLPLHGSFGSDMDSIVEDEPTIQDQDSIESWNQELSQTGEQRIDDVEDLFSDERRGCDDVTEKDYSQRNILTPSLMQDMSLFGSIISSSLAFLSASEWLILTGGPGNKTDQAENDMQDRKADEQVRVLKVISLFGSQGSIDD